MEIQSIGRNDTLPPSDFSNIISGITISFPSDVIHMSAGLTKPDFKIFGSYRVPFYSSTPDFSSSPI